MTHSKLNPKRRPGRRWFTPAMALPMLFCSGVVLGQNVVARISGVGLANDQLQPLPTFVLPAGNTRYGLEYRATSRELLVRSQSPVVCFPSGGMPPSGDGAAAYLDPNGIRYTSALQTLEVGGHPYTPHKYGSVALSQLSAMAYDVPSAEFVIELESTANVQCHHIVRAPQPLTPSQAICGGGLTDDPKDGWTDNSVFRGAFDEDLLQSPPDLELIPWREPTAPTDSLRYGFLIRNNGTSTAQAVALREFVAGDALHFQRSLSLEGSWTCRGYGGGKCDAWPSMLYEQGYMASNTGSIPPGGCLKFEAVRDFTLNATGSPLLPSGIIGARVYSDDEPSALSSDNEAIIAF